jgi:hypothetical protein
VPGIDDDYDGFRAARVVAAVSQARRIMALRKFLSRMGFGNGFVSQEGASGAAHRISALVTRAACPILLGSKKFVSLDGRPAVATRP